MTPAQFRRIALALPETVEGAHMEHPDFRVGGKIFASLTADEKRGMARLTLAQQKRLVADQPEVFEPAAGAWGRGGATMIHLRAARSSAVLDALESAWRNIAPKKIAAKYGER
jgi:hypothetical protein